MKQLMVSPTGRTLHFSGGCTHPTYDLVPASEQQQVDMPLCKDCESSLGKADTESFGTSGRSEMRFRLVSHDGSTLASDFTVGSGPYRRSFSIVQESAGGSGPDGNKRNPDYVTALETLLDRLALANCIVVDAQVVSRITEAMPQSARRLSPDPFNFPIPLAGIRDMDALRRALTSGQKTIGSTAGGGGGNERKRVRYFFESPQPDLDFEGLMRILDASQVAASTAARASGSAEQKPSWEDYSHDFRSPEESEVHVEGGQTRVVVNRYERNPRARKRCLQHYGPICQACDMSFGDTYGAIGEGFIHVHHLIEISTIGSEYEVDPINDLRPVCPNCHAMLHTRRPAYGIEELRKLLGK